MGIRVLNLVRPVLQFLPEVPALNSRLSLKERAIWTIIVLLIFLPIIRIIDVTIVVGIVVFGVVGVGLSFGSFFGFGLL